MKTPAILALALAHLGTSAQAKELTFAYPCKSYRYEKNDEIPYAAPGVKAYEFQKIATPNTARKEGGNKWNTSYVMRVYLANGTVATLPLEHAGSGDEGYNDYRITTENPYWVASGSIYNNGSGGSFEGQDNKNDHIFFECRK